MVKELCFRLTAAKAVPSRMNLCLLVALVVSPWLDALAQTPAVVDTTPPNSVEVVVNKFLSDPQLKNASFTFLAVDMATGKVIAEHNPDQSLVPASVQKLVTTATALEICGRGYRTKTLIQHDGYIDSMCVLHGNIYIKGGGDPALMSKSFKKRYEYTLLDWADAIANMGISEIDGAIVGDASIFSDDMVPSTWIWGDIANYYGAGPSGLSWRDNLLKVQFKTGPAKGDSTEVVCMKPYIPEIQIVNRVKSAKIRNDQAYFYGPPYDPYRVVKGSLPLAKDSFEVKGAIPDPPLQAAFELECALHQFGIPVKYRATTVRQWKRDGIYKKVDRVTIHETRSPALSSLVWHTNMYSVNLFAEHILNWIALRKSGRGSTGSGTIYVKKFWASKGVNTVGMYPNDGSGLSRFNALSARQLVGILKHMKKSKNYSAFNKSLPVSGKSGTLKNVGKGTLAAKNLRAKSGTMTRVKSYAGYVTSRSKKNIAFAMILNNANCSSTQSRKKLEKIMVALANYNE